MENSVISQTKENQEKKQGLILGFRTGKTWKMILAAAYYSVNVLSVVLCIMNQHLSIPLKISGILSSLFNLTLPYLINAVITACKEKKRKPLLITLAISILSFSASYLINQTYAEKSENYIYNTGKQHMSDALNHSGGRSGRRSSANQAVSGAVSSIGGFLASRGENDMAYGGTSSVDSFSAKDGTGQNLPITGDMGNTDLNNSGMQGFTVSVPQPNWENIIKDFESSHDLGVKRHFGQRYVLHDTVYDLGNSPQPYVVFKRGNMTAYLYFSEEYGDKVGRLKKGQPCAVTVVCNHAPSNHTISFMECSIAE